MVYTMYIIYSDHDGIHVYGLVTVCQERTASHTIQHEWHCRELYGRYGVDPTRCSSSRSCQKASGLDWQPLAHNKEFHGHVSLNLLFVLLHIFLIISLFWQISCGKLYCFPVLYLQILNFLKIRYRRHVTASVSEEASHCH